MENRVRKKKKQFDMHFFFSFSMRAWNEKTKDINACKKSKNLRIWRIAAIGCCKAQKPLESWNKAPRYSSNRRISYFVVFVIVLRQCSLTFVWGKNDSNVFFYPYYHRLIKCIYSWLCFFGFFRCGTRGMNLIISAICKEIYSIKKIKEKNIWVSSW